MGLCRIQDAEMEQLDEDWEEASVELVSVEEIMDQNAENIVELTNRMERVVRVAQNDHVGNETLAKDRRKCRKTRKTHRVLDTQL